MWMWLGQNKASRRPFIFHVEVVEFRICVGLVSFQSFVSPVQQHCFADHCAITFAVQYCGNICSKLQCKLQESQQVGHLIPTNVALPPTPLARAH